MISRIRAVLRRDILSLCGFIFVADCLSGLVAPTFSLYAQALGASVVLIGVLSSAVGLTSLVSAVPVGVMSDVFGRRRLLLIGMLVWCIALVLISVAPHPYVLFPGRVLMGLAMFMTFGLGAASLGDITDGRERGPAFGLYATAMGLGFTVGPIIGGLVTSWYGIAASYQVGATIAAIGFIFGFWFLPQQPSIDASAGEQQAAGGKSSFSHFGSVIRNPLISLACIGVMLQTLAFAGAIQNFFPLYANAAMIAPATIATMFSVRAFTSTMFRMPLGLASAYVTSARIMVGSLMVIGVALIGISLTTDVTRLTLLLAVEGIAFGGFVTAGQTFIAEQSTTETRGTAIGIYKMAGAAGATAGPITLGMIADHWGLNAMFIATGGAVTCGALLMIVILHRSTSEDASSSEPRPYLASTIDD